MVQNVEPAVDLHPGGFEVGDGSYDFAIVHVATGVVVLVDSEDASMRRATLVEFFKIVRVLRQDDQPACGRFPQMNQVIHSGSIEFRRYRDFVPRRYQMSNEELVVSAIIEVDA